MLVKDVIKNTAKLLNLKDVYDYLNSDIEEITIDIEEELDTLLTAVNMTNNNIATNYCELKELSENIITTFNEIDLKKITNKHDIIEIKSVISTISKNPVEYVIRGDKIVLESEGQYKVEYTYFPELVELDGSIDHYVKINDFVFALGVAGEYLFLKGAIDDAYMWDKRFKQFMLGLSRPRRNLKIPARRWL